MFVRKPNWTIRCYAALITLCGCGIVPPPVNDSPMPDGNDTPPGNQAVPDADNPPTSDRLELFGIIPAVSPEEGGEKLTITGTGFSPSTGIVFGETQANEIAFINASTLEVIAPAHAEGLVDVIASNNASNNVDGDEESRLIDAFRYTGSAPATVLNIEFVSPSSGFAGEPMNVTVTGSGFTDGMAVLFGAYASTNVTVHNANSLTARTPADATGRVVLQVIAPNGDVAFLPDAVRFVQSLATLPIDSDALLEDDGTDADGDGRTDVQELVGYEIAVDFFGFGLDPRIIDRQVVTSDPDLADTDGDGVDDGVEHVNKMNPRAADTDGDGLFDREELERWLTSPVSVDTDADARGLSPDQAPNGSLFDGGELTSLRDAEGFLIDDTGTRLTKADVGRVILGGTSPTLDDTDGDGQTDYDEFDDPIRSKLVADLPEAQVMLVDDIDIRLNVEYEESQGQETTYGTSFSTETSNTLGSSETASNTHSGEYSLAIESGTGGVNVTNNFTYGFSREDSTQVSSESTRSAQEEHSRSVTDSRTRTEIASSGSLSMGIKVRNTGNIAYELTNLGITVRQWEPSQLPDPVTGRFGSFQTLASLTAPLGDFTLAPGGVTTVLQLTDEDLSANLVRQFLARPNALFFETATFELENADGINFNFITETTFGRTGLVVVDYGDGRFDRHRVATNVDRDPASAAFLGVPMQRVMRDILGIDYEVGTDNIVGVAGSPTPQLESITRDDGTTFAANAGLAGQLPQARWILLASEGVDLTDSDGTAIPFDDIVLRNRDEIRLVFDRDQDGDGIYARKEYLYGTIDTPPDVDGNMTIDASEIQLAVDTDGDSLEDPVEMRGWMVEAGTLPSILGYPKRVFPNPTTTDTDADGMDDAAEMLGVDGLDPSDANDSLDATDPTNPDTDGDGLLDGADPFPVVPAVTLHVDANVTGLANGLTWASAMPTLREALDFATTANDPSEPGFDPTQVVSEIWVADGVYTPSGSGTIDRNNTFALINNVGIYGGFEGLDSVQFPGGENRLLQRNPQPLTNGTVLDGDGQSYTVVTSSTDAITLQPIDGSAILDGFSITGGNANETTHVSFLATTSGGGLFNGVGANPTLSNLLFTGNFARHEGGGMVDYHGVTLTHCTFNANRADTGFARSVGNFGGGGGLACVNAETKLIDCDVSGNDAVSGGGLRIVNGSVTAERCAFSGNQAGSVGDSSTSTAQGGDGGGLFVDGGDHQMINCSFRSNGASDKSDEVDPFSYAKRTELAAGGGGGAVVAGTVAFTNCEFWNNRTDWRGGGLHISGGSSAVTNCTFNENAATGATSGPFGSRGGGLYQGTNAARVVVANSIYWGNQADSTSTAEIHIDTNNGTPGILEIDNSLIKDLTNGLASHGTGNIDGDPTFENAASGNLRLKSGSVCIDLGDNLVDIDPFSNGYQPLPGFDLAAKTRVTLGTTGADEIVDMGAYEFQGD